MHTYTSMNVLKSVVERFCGKVLLIICMEIHDSGYWTRKRPRENMSGYRQVLAAPIKSLLLLLCYTRIVSVRKERLSELSWKQQQQKLFQLFSIFPLSISSPLPMCFLRKAVLPCALYVNFPCGSCCLKQPACMSVLLVVESPVIIFLLASCISLCLRPCLFHFNFMLVVSQSGKCFLACLLWRMCHKDLQQWIANIVLGTSRILQLAAKAQNGWKAEMSAVAFEM